jgi:hypothetical protein
MTTASLKNNQLPNNRLQVFKSNTKSNTKLVKASDGLFNCSLKLPNGSSMIIPMREDGMINATMLCKAHGKKLLANYNQNKQTKEYLQALSLNIGIPILELFVTTVGGNHSGTWVHRKVAIHLAQWLSPSFAVQVSNWLDELFITGKVELGQEKSNKELENKFQEQIKQLTQEKQQAIEEKEQVILEKATITRRLSSVTQNHNKMLKRRRRGVYEIGNVVYILSHVAFTTYYQDDYYKIGMSTQSASETTPAFKNRLSSYKTGAPQDYKVHYLIYVENNKLIEEIIKLKYKNQLNPSNGEWIKSVKLEEIINSIRHLCEYIGLPCKEHSIMKNKNIVDDGKVLDCEDEEDIEETELLSDKFTEVEIIETDENTDSEKEDETELLSDKFTEIEIIETDENTDSEKEDEEIDIEESEVKQVEMIEEIEKYDAKQLTKMLLQFELKVWGSKDEKKKRIREYAKKNKTIVEEYISNVMEKEKQNFCIDCKTEITYKAARCKKCYSKSSIRDIPIPDYETLKKQYEDCGKNMSELAKVYKMSDNALKKWFVKYEKELGITKSCIKSIKPKSSIKKPSDEELLYDRNVLKLNYTQIGLKYNVDRTTATEWILKLII